MIEPKADRVSVLDLEDTEWPLRATELAALHAFWAGRLGRAGFRRWLRSEGWPAGDIDDLTLVVEHVRDTEVRMPVSRRRVTDADR